MEYSIALLKNNLVEINISLAEDEWNNAKHPTGIWDDVIARYKEIIKDLEAAINLLETKTE